MILGTAILAGSSSLFRWGKEKLAAVLRCAGWTVSTSIVGRILARLKARGLLREAPLAAISIRKRAFRRPHAVRKPKGYAVDQPGDLIQADTLDVRPVPGVVLKHFTARDIVSRWDVLEAPHSRVPGSGVRGRGSGERETTASSLAGKHEAREKEDNGGQGKDGPAGAIAQGGNGR